MKKIAGLLIGDECDQQLLGLDEKHDRLFIKKDQELILFSLDTFKVVGRFNHMGYPDSVIFTENGRYAAVVFRQGLSYRNKVYVIDLSEDPADIKFSYQGEAADSYRFTIHSLSNYPNHILIGRKHSLELFDCEKGKASEIFSTKKEIHLVKVIEGENEDYIAVRYVPERQPNPNIPTIDPPDIQYYKLKDGFISNWENAENITQLYFKERTFRFAIKENQTILTNLANKIERTYDGKIYKIGIERVDEERQYACGSIYCFNQSNKDLIGYSFLMDTKTLMPVCVQKDGPSLYYYAKRNYLIYEEDSREDYIAIVEFTEEDHQSLTMELLSKGKVKKNRVDSKGFKQIVL